MSGCLSIEECFKGFFYDSELFICILSPPFAGVITCSMQHNQTAAKAKTRKQNQISYFLSAWLK